MGSTNSESPIEVVDLNRVIDDQIRGTKRVDVERVSTEPLDRVSDGGKVDDGRDAREVLQQNARRFEGHFHVVPPVFLPVENSLHVLGFHLEVVAVAHCRLEQNAHGKRKFVWTVSGGKATRGKSK